MGPDIFSLPKFAGNLGINKISSFMKILSEKEVQGGFGYYFSSNLGINKISTFTLCLENFI